MNRQFLLASLILVGCTLAPDRERAPLDASLTDAYGECRTDELYACHQLQDVGRFATMPGYDYMMARGYQAILDKVGMDFERLEAEYGDAERGLVALGCDDQAPGMFRSVLRPGDVARDMWCSQVERERLERVRAGKGY